jgi:hypothetical protein
MGSVIDENAVTGIDTAGGQELNEKSGAGATRARDDGVMTRGGGLRHG